MKNKLSDIDISGRVWAFVLYPDSCIDYLDMITQLSYLGVPLAVSPLHLPEKNLKQENEKKPHYHCIMYFDGQKKQNQLKYLQDMSSTSYSRKYFDWHYLVDKNTVIPHFAKYPYFLKVNSIRHYTRYLLHLDSPDKQQFTDYKISTFVSDDEQKYNNMVLLNGYNVRDYLKANTVTPDLQLLQIVDENEFKTINQLMKYLAYNNNEYLLDYIKKNMGYISRFLLADLCFYNYRDSKKK